MFGFRMTPSGTPGDVVGPNSSTDNAIARFDGTTGKFIQNSVVVIDDTGNISGIGTLGVGAITSTGLLTVALAGNTATFRNTTDANSVQVAIFEGDRATMSDNDEAYITLRLSNDGGTQTEVARITWAIPDVNAGTSEDGRLDFSVMTAGSLAKELQLSGADLSPSSSDGLALGTLSLPFSDLFLASGSVIDWANDITLTHSSNVLTLAGGNLIISTAGTASGSVVTINGSQTLSNKTLTAPVFASGGFIADANGNELIIFTTTASAVNELTYANGSTGVNPRFTASGDANVGIDFEAKGTGVYRFLGNATQAAELRLYEDTDNGTNYTAFKVGAQSADITYTLPTDDGDANQLLSTNGSGVLDWVDPPSSASIETLIVDTAADTANLSISTGDSGTGSKSSNYPGITLSTGTATSGVGGCTRAAYNPTGSTLTVTTADFLANSPYMTINIAGVNMNVASDTASSFFGIGYFVFAANAIDYTGFTHVGFKLVKTGGVVSLYATQTSAGSNTASSALTTIVNGDVLELSFKKNGSTSVDYYWRKNGGALSAATNLSTNVPTAAVGTLGFQVTNDNTATGFSVNYFGFTYKRA